MRTRWPGVSSVASAILLVGTVLVSAPAGASGTFSDDDGSVHEGAIQAIAAANITLGCNPPTNTKYCPDRPVTRAEMATFLTRALDLAVVQPPPPPTGSTVVFAAAGDLGAENSTAEVLGHIGGSDAEFLFALGDLSYNQITPESSWCSWVRSKLDSTLPVQMAVGNHEHDSGSDGSWDKFAQCLPDAMTSTGDYPAQYFFDVRGTVRIIVASAGLKIDGHQYTYEPGSADAQWLTAAIRSARTSGIEWVMVGTHKPCISVGAKKDCEPERHLTDLAISEGVDLMLHGHDHNYQRSHQLSCIAVDLFSPACVSDSDGSHRAGDGTVLVVSGAVRDDSLYAVSSSDSEAGYFADYLGANSANSGAGYVEVTATPNSLIVEFIGVTTNHSDTIEIRK